MRSLPLLTVAAVTACGDVGVRVVPNKAPLAVGSVGLVADGVPRFVGYVALGGTVTLDGSLSDDTDRGNVESFRWHFDSIPEGSALLDENITVNPDDGGTDVQEDAIATFVPDLEGQYRIQLFVTDDDGAESEPAVVIVDASPPGDLEVTLTWETAGADLDLHVVRPGGDYFGVVAPQSDCFSWVPNPNWGDPAAAEDNPILAQDSDTVGANEESPFSEVVVLPHPEDGVYTIYVHYYSDHLQAMGNGSTPTSATLSLRAAGEDVDNGIIVAPSNLSQGEVWVAGQVHWPAQEFGPIGEVTDHGDLGGPPYNEQD
jgi:hypothetical protein